MVDGGDAVNVHQRSSHFLDSSSPFSAPFPPSTAAEPTTSPAAGHMSSPADSQDDVSLSELKERMADFAKNVLASKTKIYMILEYVNGGELFDTIASKGKLSESDGRKLFQQLIDGVSYCHDKGVYHRDLKLENVLVDAKGGIKISDFGLSALPQHLRDDELLHTTCGSPNYVAPEILSNRGYDGATSDTWSCGVILYVILTGYLPFDDRNLAVLYQKVYFKGDVQMPKWLPSGAKNLIKRILDPNPKTRIIMADIKADEWRAIPVRDREQDSNRIMFLQILMMKMRKPTDSEKVPESPGHINAFELISMSSSLALSGFFEKEDVSERKVRFTSTYSSRKLLEKIDDTASQMGLRVQKKNGKLKVVQHHKERRKSCNLSVTAEQAAYTNSLPNALLAANSAPALETGVFSSSQPTQQTPPGNTIATGPALPQHLTVHPYSQHTLPLDPFANMIGYPFLPQSYTYKPSRFQQAFAGNSTYHQQLAAVLPQYKNSVSVSSLPQSAAVLPTLQHMLKPLELD
ncbi:hypothetical protein M8C21_007675 [Ambrosia artemisiifolia]|uniref:non-specific serine/threonine protein kinase n=1 Tax=Ambrosia artemisiifolia TaxID=4212 RepID=A0AAD5DEB3_AMBAR|nr:hypothetical protein M8C21_007675 [Ambrosia artemisiifolia]